MSETLPYAGADWLEAQGYKLSPLGKRVADLLGQLEKGIYHIDSSALKKVEWVNKYRIAIVLPSPEFATFDFRVLTELVVLCHDACIRCQIEGRAKGYIQFSFSQRSRFGSFTRRHPFMEDAVRDIREHLLCESLKGEMEVAP